MRLNAPIPAFWALAALLLLPITLGATVTGTKRLHARGAEAVAASVHRAKPAGRRKAGASASSRQRFASAPVHLVSTHGGHRSRQGLPVRPTERQGRPLKGASIAQGPVRRHRRPLAKETAGEPILVAESVQGDVTPQKATSEDFLKAADASGNVPVALAIHGSSQARELNDAAPTDVGVVGVAAGTASKPVAVVSVIRSVAERPQLPNVEEAASTPVILPALYNKRGRLILPPPLKGSREILLRQNQIADRDGLHRVQNDDDLMEMREQRLLVALPVSGALEVDERLPQNRRYCRPWTAQFLSAMARAHYAQFHTPLQVNSAVRTAEFQQHLMRINGNAAPAEGDTASPHLTGQAIDIAKHGLSMPEIAWMRGYLLPMVQEGKVDVEEEFQQSCFHISVYKRYGDGAPRRSLALSHVGETSALATAVR